MKGEVPEEDNEDEMEEIGAANLVAVPARPRFLLDLTPHDLYSDTLGFLDWMDEPCDWDEDISGDEDEEEDARPHKKIKLSSSKEDSA